MRQASPHCSGKPQDKDDISDSLALKDRPKAPKGRVLKTLRAAFQQGDFWYDNQTLRKNLTVVRLPRMSRKVLFLLLQNFFDHI